MYHIRVLVFTLFYFHVSLVGNIVIGQQRLVVQTGHLDNIRAIIESENGNSLYTAGGDNQVIQWNASSGLQMRNYIGHTKSSAAIDLADNGRMLVSAGDDQLIKIWETNTGKLVNSIGGFRFGFTSIKVSNDGRYLAATNRDRTITCWDLKQNAKRSGYESLLNYGDMGDVCFDDAGNIYFAIWDHRIYFTNLHTDPDLKQLDSITIDENRYGYIHAMRVTPDGKRIVIGVSGFDEEKGSVLLIDRATKKIVHQYYCFPTAMGSYSNSLDLSKNGRYLLTGNEDTLTLVDLSNNRVSQVEIRGCGAVRLAGNGTQLYAASENRLQVLSLPGLQIIKEYKGYGNPVTAMQLTNDGKLVTTHGNRLQLWDICMGRSNPFAETLTTQIEEGKLSTISRDLRFVAFEKGENAMVYNVEREKRVAMVTNLSGVSQMQFSKEGNYLIAGGKEITLASRANNFDVSWHINEYVDNDMYDNLQIFDGEKSILTNQLFDDVFSVYDIASRKKKYQVKYESNRLGPFQFSKKYIAGIVQDKLNDYQNAFLTNIKDAYDKKTAPVVTDQEFLTSQSALDVPKYVVLWDITNGKLIKRLMPRLDSSSYFTGQPSITALAFDETEKSIATASDDNTISIWDITAGKEIKKLSGHHMTVTNLVYDAQFLYSAGMDGTIIIWNAVTYEKLVTLLLLNDNDYAVVADDNYYLSSRYGVKALAFEQEGKMFSFEHFDLKFNRPDIVLKKLGCANPLYVSALFDAYKKRLKRTGIAEDSLSTAEAPPVINVINRESIAAFTTDSMVTIRFTATDSVYGISQCEVMVNEVPLCVYTREMTKMQTSFSFDPLIRLAPRVNRITATVTNNRGVHTVSDPVEINYASARPVKIFFAGIAVSGYLDSQYNLKYAEKDIRDIAAALQKKYPNLVVDTLTGNQVTKENVMALGKRLNQATENDIVIFSLSGHGLLNKKLDFYFASYDVDFKNPDDKGIRYDDLENMLSCIPARKKLFLMDACNSGEVDRAADLTVVIKNEVSRGEDTAQKRGVIVLSNKNEEKANRSFELMQEFFAGFSKSSGSIVISASAGQSYALESDQWKNGVFSYSFINGLLSGKADLNKNGTITVTELQRFVIKEVYRLTKGMQKPTSRKENIYYDWTIW